MWIDIAIIVIIVLAVIGGTLFLLQRWASKRYADQQSAIAQNKQPATIYVIDKKRDFARNVNLPKIVMESLPKISGRVKMYFVQAKIGPQIMTLICEKAVYNAVPVKKTIKVDLAGIYIVHVKGMKSPEELKAAKREKAAAERKAEKEAKGK